MPDMGLDRNGMKRNIPGAEYERVQLIQKILGPYEDMFDRKSVSNSDLSQLDIGENLARLSTRERLRDKGFIPYFWSLGF